MKSKKAPPSRLGAVVYAKRTMMGLSQRQLGEITGLNNATICKVEKDPSLDPDIRTIRLLAEALQLDYSYLLALAEIIKDDPDLRIIARARMLMTEEQKQEMIVLLRETFPEAFAKAGGDGINAHTQQTD